MNAAVSHLPPMSQKVENLDTKKQMENELKASRKELETTKQALKVQVARCRHLVAAFTRKLAEKDAELKSCRVQRDVQLSGLLRALLVLEARLRREQKSIKDMLADKDNVINDQKLEIEKLKSEVTKAQRLQGTEEVVKEVVKEEPEVSKKDSVELYAKPDLISSLGIPDGAPDSLSSESTRSCMGDDGDYVVTSPQIKGILSVHDRSAFSPINKKEYSSFSTENDARVQDVRVTRDKYQDNPVLQCVNQILLKDQEDFLEERSFREKDKWLDEEDSPEGETQDEDGPGEKVDRNRLNPPLPPKPKIRAKKVEFADLKQMYPSTVLQAIDPQLNIPLSILEPIEHQDKDLYVISNSALDDDIVKQLRGRTLNVSGLHIKPQRITNDRNQHSNVPTGLLHPNHNTTKAQPDPFLNENLFLSPKSQNNVLKVNIQESPKRSSFGFKSPPKVGMPNMIKVASPVATLLTSAQESPKEDLAPSVSQMVRRFEDLGTKPPEEETKDDKEPKEQGSVSYDNFLEATGLSQKSIITPSRLLTNHRSVTKPKDVKLRSRVKSSGVIERFIPPQVVGPTVKYWTEPFL